MFTERQATAAAPQEPSFIVADRRLSGCVERINEATRVVNMLADHMFGAQPTGVEASGKSVGLIGRIDETEQALSGLESAIRRFAS